VREKAGLAYYAYSSLNMGTGPGVWYAAAGVDPTDIEQAVDLIVKEFDRLQKETVSQEELADSQTNFIGRLPLGLESNAGLAAAIIHLERYQLGLNYYRIYPGLLQAVTQEDVLQASSI
jgi:zinc protease